jgi:hypothetical protein
MIQDEGSGDSITIPHERAYFGPSVTSGSRSVFEFQIDDGEWGGLRYLPPPRPGGVDADF